MDHPASLPTGGRPLGGRVACSRSPIYVFTMPIVVFTMDRSRCSRCADLAVHVGPIWAFSMDRNPHSCLVTGAAARRSEGSQRLRALVPDVAHIHPQVSERRLCRVVGLNRATVRRVARELVTRQATLIHQHPTFGSRRLWALLRFREGQRIAAKTVYRVRKLQRWFVHQRPATPRPRAQGRRSRAAHSNDRWATDVAHVYCGADGWAHLAAIIDCLDDCLDREIVGYEFARRGRAKGAERATEEACLARFGTLRPTGASPVIRSDNGLIYQCRRFRAAWRDYRLRQEFMTPYTPEQYGMIERFFRSLKEECVWQHLIPSFAAAGRVIAAWIRWYNEAPAPGAGLSEPARTSGATGSTGGLISGEHNRATDRPAASGHSRDHPPPRGQTSWGHFMSAQAAPPLATVGSSEGVPGSAEDGQWTDGRYDKGRANVGKPLNIPGCGGLNAAKEGRCLPPLGHSGHTNAVDTIDGRRCPPRRCSSTAKRFRSMAFMSPTRPAFGHGFGNHLIGRVPYDDPSSPDSLAAYCKKLYPDRDSL